MRPRQAKNDRNGPDLGVNEYAHAHRYRAEHTLSEEHQAILLQKVAEEEEDLPDLPEYDPSAHKKANGYGSEEGEICSENEVRI